MPIAAIEEVLPALPIEAVPHCPGFVRGVVYLRGHLIPVVNAAEHLGLRNHQVPDEPNIVCVRSGRRLIGVEFDEALDLWELDLDRMLPAGELGAGKGFFAGIVEHNGHLLRLLDPERLTSIAEEVQWVG